jgi:hypothetical protein
LKITQRDFPLNEAYKFAVANGIGEQAETSGRILSDMIEKV